MCIWTAAREWYAELRIKFYNAVRLYAFMSALIHWHAIFTLKMNKVYSIKVIPQLKKRF